MIYIILPDLCIIFFFINLVIKSFKKIFMSCFIINCIIVYNIIKIPDILKKVDNCI